MGALQQFSGFANRWIVCFNIVYRPISAMQEIISGRRLLSARVEAAAGRDNILTDTLLWAILGESTAWRHNSAARIAHICPCAQASLNQQAV
jgi:hypothetical protein